MQKNNIYEYACDIDINEKNKINNYVDNNTRMHINDCYNIVVNNNIVGCLLYYKHDDGILLDEIYIEELYRNKGIGRSIISRLLECNDIVYLYVYKENKIALVWYKKLGFKVLDETEYRYYMKYSK